MLKLLHGIVFISNTVRVLLKTRQEKAREDIYYHNIASSISWHAVSKKTPVEACQINSIMNQISQVISKKQRKRKEATKSCVINSKARKTNLCNATCERS